MTLTVLLFWINFFSSDPSTCYTVAFPPLENSDHSVASVYFSSNSKRDAPFYRKAYDYFRADWDDLHDFLRDVL